MNPSDPYDIELDATVPESMQGQRLDKVAARLFPDYSRERLKQWILDGALTHNDEPAKPRMPVVAEATLAIRATLTQAADMVAQDLSLRPIYEDEALLVVNKPAGLVVHPGAGQPDGTLQNALLHHDAALAHLPRAGIVHRLDKDTSGLMVVAKTLESHHALVQQLQAREVSRFYYALCVGKMTGGGKVDAPIGRHPVKRVHMAVNANGKPAVSHYRLLQSFSHHSLVKVMLETGRTHQIRVHMAHRRYPLVGDKTYGGRLRLPKGATPTLRDALTQFPRQALHAFHLAFNHPLSKQPIAWTIPMPNDLAGLLAVLAANEAAS